MTQHDILLSARGITKSFAEGEGDTRTILDSLDLEIRRQSLVVIRGESGCGKSTLLRILGLVDPEFRGELDITGERVGGDGRQRSISEVEDFRARHVGFVFQDDLLLPLLNLHENSELPARIHRLPKKLVDGRMSQLEDLIFRPVELRGGVLGRHRTTVSGGQRQRAAILRAVSHGPALIVADEPTASLDSGAKAEVVKLFKRLCQMGHTIVVASHDSIFLGVGETYELSKGKLQKVQQVEELPKPRALEDLHENRPEKHRGCPPDLQAKIALREAWGNKLFAVMIIAAMAAGLFQLTLLWSVREGTQKVLDEVINKGSRLDRVAVAAKAPDGSSEGGGLPSSEILAPLEGTIRTTVERREIVLRVDDARGRERQETSFGLIPDDPEIDKLELREGSPFVNQDDLAVLITERSVERLFGADAVGQPATDKTLEIRFRRYLRDTSDTQELFATTTEAQKEEVGFEFRVQGVLDRAEAGRNLYLPQGTLLAIAGWQIDQTLGLEAQDGRLALTGTPKEPPAWERLHVYFDSLDDVLPAASHLERQGFASKADLFRYRWILDTRRFVNWMLGGIIGMVLGIAGLLLMSNVVSGVRLKRKEIAVLKLMGMKDRDVVTIFVLSVLICALIGGALGFAMGSATVDTIRGYIADAYPESPLGEVLTSTWPYLIHALILSSLVTVLFTVFPAWRTARKEAVWRID